jgi:hypothetical protein
VHHLQPGVDAAVGSSGTGDIDRFAGDPGERTLKGILHRAAAGLGLPAEEPTAVVLEA